MSFERAVNDNENGSESFTETVERVRSLMQSSHEAVAEFPRVSVHGTEVGFSIERDPDLLALAAVQQLVCAIDGEIESVRYQAREASADAKEQLQNKEYALTRVRAHAEFVQHLLENRADAVSDAHKRPEYGDLVRLLDDIALEPLRESASTA